MSRSLEGVFAELGLTPYLGAFVDQGFDTWETILDIQESDLDTLGVKLGHRRKLQRRIANARGIAPSVSLPSPLNPASEDAKQEAPRPEPSRSDNLTESNGVSKRKYRRHPKSDEHAPERPPSAYVLFSNKMREDLKSQNLTFTEIAKLVGENWQNLDPAEKETYESQANTSKEKYHRELVEYKKTPEYRRYAHYLHGFKEKQAKQNQAQDAPKRPKLEPLRQRAGSTSSGTPVHTNSSGSGSGSERLQGSEPPPSRQERMDSTASIPDSSAVAAPRLQEHAAEDKGLLSRTAHLDMNSSRELNHGSGRPHSTWGENRRNGDSAHRNLPSLSDMLDDGKMGTTASSEVQPYGSGFGASNGWPPVPDGPSVLPPRRAPLLRHETPSTESHGSMSSTPSYSRPAREGSLPIHALLSTGPTSASESSSFNQSPPIAVAGLSSPESGPRPFAQAPGTRGYGFQSGSSAFQHMNVQQSGDGDVVMTTDDRTSTPRVPVNRKEGFDGMNALLRAGEIVGRRQGE